ncbi:MAG TPA: hypothetical protein VLD84_00900 [Nitrososphaeraceae archaeon]|nr:hypothetical protein [Nitrososphaeraceae archaeon]
MKEKAQSSNVHTLFKTKFDEIETIIPTNVACIYQIFGTVLDKSNETRQFTIRPLAPTMKNLPAFDKNMPFYESHTSLQNYFFV